MISALFGFLVPMELWAFPSETNSHVLECEASEPPKVNLFLESEGLFAFLGAGGTHARLAVIQRLGF